MKHRKWILKTLVLSCALTASTGYAAPTSPINYQGQLKFGDVPVNGRADFAFRLFREETGGDPIAVLELSAVAVTNGLFDVDLRFDSEVFNGDPRWLEIRVRTEQGDATLSPRQLITPAPYALYAYKTPPSSGGDSPWLVNGSNIYYNTGRVGIGINSPTHDLHVISSANGAMMVESTATANSTYAIGGKTGAGNGWAVYGHATAVSGNAAGGYFETDSSGGWGVRGIANSAGGIAKGGYFTSNASMGKRVYGRNRSLTGSMAYGVHGRTASNAGRGVYGEATETSGTNYGVYGETASPSGYGGYFVGRGYFSGNVGIGVAVPDAKLDVAGRIQATELQLGTSATSGDVLTADSQGVATWQPPTLRLPYVSSVDADGRSALSITNTGSGIGTHAISAVINNAGHSEASAGYFNVGNRSAVCNAKQGRKC